VKDAFIEARRTSGIPNGFSRASFLTQYMAYLNNYCLNNE
jgi:hypothetical protein